MNVQIKARTNFVKIENLEELKKSIECFDVKLIEHSQEEGVFMLKAVTDDGDFPGFQEDEDGNEIMFSFESSVMPFVEEGQVLVAMSAGHQGDRAILGVASAYLRTGKEITSSAISLSDIYSKAAKEFGVSEDQINRCEHEDTRRSQKRRA